MREGLRADCRSCHALCCVGPPFRRSADFPIDKPAGRACPHLDADDRCAIHGQLAERGFHGCVAFDCFGAGQVASARHGRGPQALALLGPLRRVHELRWLLAEAAERGGDEGLGAVAEHLDGSDSRAIDELQGAVGALLRRISSAVRSPAGDDLERADLAGADLRRRDLRRASLRSALLLGADLRGADLERCDLLGADLRGADLRGADLRSALWLTRAQAGAARTDGATRLPAHLY